MSRINTPIFARIAALAAFFLLGLSTVVPAHQAMAKEFLGPVRTVDEFNGQITAVGGPTDAPTSLTLLNKASQPVTFKVRLDTTLKPLSAEAEVEGLVPGDYADVFAFRVSRTWVAARVLFDVQPVIMTRQVIVTGLITRVRADGRRLWMKLATGEIRPVAIPAKTIWLVDGLPAGGPVALARGNLVQVKMRRTANSNGWFALSINLKSTVS